MDFYNANIVIKVFFNLYAYICFVISYFIKPRRVINVFGGAPIIKFSRWARILNHEGISSISIVPSIYAINDRKDFDLTWQDFVPKIIARYRWTKVLAPALSWFWIVRNAKTVSAPVGGISFFDWNMLGYLELKLLKYKGIKVITIVGGGDAYMLGHIHDPSVRQALQASYPSRARIHTKIELSVRKWEENADVFITSQMLLDGFARNDYIVPHLGAVDSEYFCDPIRLDKKTFSVENPLRVLHAPNHKHFKGTAFLVEAIAILREKGLHIELEVTEGIKHHQLLHEIHSSDVVVDQLIMPGYSNFAIECMALGKPVIGNLEDSSFRTIMNRYSFLRECPILSANPESITQVLISIYQDEIDLVKLRVESREYALKHHSSSAWISFWKMLELSEFNGDYLVRNLGSISPKI